MFTTLYIGATTLVFFMCFGSLLSVIIDSITVGNSRRWALVEAGEWLMLLFLLLFAITGIKVLFDQEYASVYIGIAVFFLFALTVSSVDTLIKQSTVNGRINWDLVSPDDYMGLGGLNVWIIVGLAALYTNT